MVESSLSRALSFLEATEDKRFIEDTAILQSAIFKTIVESKKATREKQFTPFVILEGLIGQLSLKSLSDQITKLLRETDYIGMGDENKFHILLSNSGEQDAKRVLSRLEQHQINMRIVEGEV
jgi:hypothetical protein